MSGFAVTASTSRPSRRLIEDFLRSHRYVAEVKFTDKDYVSIQSAIDSIRNASIRMGVDSLVYVYGCLDRVFIERR